MTTPPDHIWLARAWAETFTTQDERENVEPYVRRDPAVLAELPEVRAYAATLNAAEAQVDIYRHALDLVTQLGNATSQRIARDAFARAAAIREARND